MHSPNDPSPEHVFEMAQEQEGEQRNEEIPDEIPDNRKTQGYF